MPHPFALFAKGVGSSDLSPLVLMVCAPLRCAQAFGRAERVSFYAYPAFRFAQSGMNPRPTKPFNARSAPQDHAGLFLSVPGGTCSIECPPLLQQGLDAHLTTQVMDSGLLDGLPPADFPHKIAQSLRPSDGRRWWEPTPIAL